MNNKQKKALQLIIDASTYWLPDDKLEEAYKILNPLIHIPHIKSTRDKE